jgi:NitT/TauT family transport system substrate-binding protein
VPLRRRTLLGAAAATLAAACGPSTDRNAILPAAVGPLETTTIRVNSPAGCDPWTWLVGDFLNDEGFTDVVFHTPTDYVTLSGNGDIDVAFNSDVVQRVDAGQPIVALAGTHTGCIELWARPGINAISDLRGKRILVDKKDPLLDPFYGLWLGFLASVGLDAQQVRIEEIDDPTHTNIEHFVAGRSDAILASITEGPALRANPSTPGRMIFDNAVDKPWSQYFCCMLVARADWARANPNAAKRATRAVLRAIDDGAKDHARATARGVAAHADDDAKLLRELIDHEGFNWRDYDPEDTLRYYALRLADAKLLKKTPSRIIADGTDFAFFRQMQRDLKT